MKSTRNHIQLHLTCIFTTPSSISLHKKIVNKEKQIVIIIYPHTYTYYKYYLNRARFCILYVIIISIASAVDASNFFNRQLLQCQGF